MVCGWPCEGEGDVALADDGLVGVGESVGDRPGKGMTDRTAGKPSAGVHIGGGIDEKDKEAKTGCMHVVWTYVVGLPRARPSRQSPKTTPSLRDLWRIHHQRQKRPGSVRVV